MKTRLLLLATFLAFVAGSVALADTSYVLNGTTASVAPTGANQTGAVTIANGLRGMGVAIGDNFDGGNDVDLISGTLKGHAWIYNSGYLNIDGGAGWLRYPRLDVNGIADAGGIAVQGANGVIGQFFTIDPTVTSGFVGQKLYYTVENATYDDAGPAVVRVTLTPLY